MKRHRNKIDEKAEQDAALAQLLAEFEEEHGTPHGTERTNREDKEPSGRHQEPRGRQQHIPKTLNESMPSHKRPFFSGDDRRSMTVTLNPRQLTVDLGKASTLPELLSLHQAHGSQFNGFHVGAFWSRFKKLARGELGGLSDRLVPVCEQTVQMLPKLGGRGVANIAHAFAKSGLVSGGSYQGVWAALEEVARRRIVEFDEQALSNTAWAFAKAKRAAPALFNII